MVYVNIWFENQVFPKLNKLSFTTVTAFYRNKKFTLKMGTPFGIVKRKEYKYKMLHSCPNKFYFVINI